MAKKKFHNEKNKLSPITFKVPQDMYSKINSIVERGEYKSRAEMIRRSIENFIEDENRLKR